MRDPLVTAGELADRLGDPWLRIADVRWYLGEPERGLHEYSASHIPGAVYVDLERDLSAPGAGRHPLPGADAFAARLGELGIGNEHFVVAYDSRGGAIAARLWWMLRSLGHEAAAVLDGGLEAWRAAGLPETTVVPGLPPARFDHNGWTAPAVDRGELERRAGEVLIVDARDPERYRGDEEPVDPVAGHIPGAVNIPYAGNLGDDGTFLPAAELRRRYTAAGVTDPASTVFYCGSGVTACHDLLALEVAGLPGAALYPGSWSDWCTAGLPVETRA